MSIPGIYYSAKNKILDALGRECKQCGLKSDVFGFFDLDHIVPKKRSKKFHYRGNLSYSKDLEKVQVLCPNCHRMKTIKDRQNGWK